jgi:hypothetical protein
MIIGYRQKFLLKHQERCLPQASSSHYQGPKMLSQSRSKKVWKTRIYFYSIFIFYLMEMSIWTALSSKSGLLFSSWAFWSLLWYWHYHDKRWFFGGRKRNVSLSAGMQFLGSEYLTCSCWIRYSSPSSSHDYPYRVRIKISAIIPHSHICNSLLFPLFFITLQRFSAWF